MRGEGRTTLSTKTVWVVLFFVKAYERFMFYNSELMFVVLDELSMYKK